MGRQRHSLPAGILAAAALPYVQVAAVALWERSTSGEIVSAGGVLHLADRLFA